MENEIEITTGTHDRGWKEQGVKQSRARGRRKTNTWGKLDTTAIIPTCTHTVRLPISNCCAYCEMAAMLVVVEALFTQHFCNLQDARPEVKHARSYSASWLGSFVVEDD